MKQDSPDSQQKRTISDYFIVSQGGGFTGAYESYLVYRNGRIIQLIGETDSSYIATLAPETTDSLFQTLLSLNIPDKALSAPGNMNYEITTCLNSDKKTLKWSDNERPDDAIMRFYTFVLLEVKKPKK